MDYLREDIDFKLVSSTWDDFIFTDEKQLGCGKLKYKQSRDMEHGNKKYILLCNLPESNQESNSMTAGLWGVLSGYVFGGESSEKPEVLRGELLQSLPSSEHQDESGKIQLAGIKQKYLRTECFESQLAALSDEEAELLLAVRSYTARCSMVEQQMLDQLLSVAEGSQVFVYHKELNRYLAASVCYKGAVPPHNGVMFGVQIVVI